MTGRRSGRRSDGLQVLTVRAVYAVALCGAVALAWLFISAAGTEGTLGFDYRAYDIAVDRLLAGQSMYDASAQSTGSFGLFFYPPPFALLVLPLAMLPTEQAVWVWTLALIAASVVAIGILPVGGWVRLAVGLLAALSWPLVYAIKLGQGGPMLLLLFSVGCRFMDRPGPLGVVAGVGAAIKLQPALLIGWALATGRRRAAAIGI